jgi:protein-disulfide isomerase
MSCVKDGKFNKQIEADMALGTKLGASGTPTFFVSSKTVVGAQDFTVFEQEIEAALKS